MSIARTKLVMTSILLLLFGLLSVLNAQPYPYTVNEVPHPNCNTPLISMETGGLPVVRGHDSAPCVGYLKYDLEGAGGIVRMCGSNNNADNRINFHKEAAERACYTLGKNMWRIDNFGSNNDEQIMLYTCDEYTEAGVEFPEYDGGDATVAGVMWGLYGSEVAKRCDPVTTNVDNACFEECYGTSYGVEGETEDDCEEIAGPFWAITCSDHDECLNGVLGNCKGPFKDSCITRPACGNNTHCLNLQGSFSCSCQDGFKLATGDALDPYKVGVGCVDINECLVDDACGVNGQCINTQGSYHCICPHHSLWDQAAYKCIGKDECLYDDICGPHGKCQNTIDSYICICPKPDLWDEETKKCLTATCELLPELPHATPITQNLYAPVYGDKMVYTCDRGYETMVQTGLASGLYTNYGYYGYSASSTFELTCNEEGHWSPYQVPVCLPVNCGDPGIVADADRKGKSFKYDDDMVYKCRTGFKPKDYSLGSQSFTRKCQEDGYWSPGTTCEDVNECKDHPTICGTDSEYCINTIGSYMCSCVPWYQSDASDNRCVEWAGLADFPNYNPCQILDSFGGCQNGECEVVNNKAECNCDSGYEGTLCDRLTISTGVTVAIVALVLVFILLLVCLVCCCYRSTHHHVGVGGPPALAPPRYMARKAGVEPIYGVPTRARPGYFMNRF